MTVTTFLHCFVMVMLFVLGAYCIALIVSVLMDFYRKRRFNDLTRKIQSYIFSARVAFRDIPEVDAVCTELFELINRRPYAPPSGIVIQQSCSYAGKIALLAKRVLYNEASQEEKDELARIIQNMEQRALW